MENNKGNAEPDRTVADIGYPIREDASGGGVVLTAESMVLFSKMGIDIYYSEYAGHCRRIFIVQVYLDHGG